MERSEILDRLYKFEVEDIKQIDSAKYPSNEFCVARMGFLSTRPNSHRLEITPNVIKASAPSVLGKFVVADVSDRIDAKGHTDKEWIQGYIPNEQKVEFAEDEDGYLRAYVDAVISKFYAKDFVNMFERDNKRAVSVEMQVATPEDDEHKVDAFNIVGVTVLGKSVRPSCPQSDIVLTRFSEDEAEKYYADIHEDKNCGKEEMTEMEEQNIEMTEKTEEVEMEQTEEVNAEEQEVECSEEEAPVDFEAKCAQLSADIESRDNIIMEKDAKIAELEAKCEELSKFKEAVELERKTAKVNSMLSEVEDYIDSTKMSELKQEGIACENIDAWCNSVKSIAFEVIKSKKQTKKDEDIMRFAAPTEPKTKKSKGLWE